MVSFTDRAATIEPPVIRRLRELLATENAERLPDKVEAKPREVLPSA